LLPCALFEEVYIIFTHHECLAMPCSASTSLTPCRVFYKQRDNHYFPPASYVLSYVLTQLPYSIVEVRIV